jgi:hypothetical protein
MSNNNPYIQAYLKSQAQQSQAQQSQAQQSQAPQQSQMDRPVHPQQSQYIPQYKMQPVNQQQPAEPPRQYTQFPTQTPTNQPATTSQGFGGTDQYSGLNVFDQTVMKHSLESEKVISLDRRTFESHINNAQKSREEIDKQLAAARISAVAPTTIKVEKKPIDDLNAIAARRQQEAAQLKVEKVTNDASALFGATAVKKTDPSQLNRQMDELIKRRQQEMQNITYK